MRLSPHHEMSTDSPVLGAEQFRVPINHVRSLDLLDGSLESPREHPHTSRRTLMSPQEWETARCTPDQLEMKPDSPALALEPSAFHIIQDKFLDFLWASTEIP